MSSLRASATIAMHRVMVEPRGTGMSDVVFRFAHDSPLEGDGFEPSVPRQKDCEKAKELISHKRQVRKGRTGQSPQSMEVSIWNSLPKGAPF